MKDGEYNVNKTFNEAFVRPGQRITEWGFQSVSSLNCSIYILLKSFQISPVKYL